MNEMKHNSYERASLDEREKEYMLGLDYLLFVISLVLFPIHVVYITSCAVKQTLEEEPNTIEAPTSNKTKITE